MNTFEEPVQDSLCTLCGDEHEDAYMRYVKEGKVSRTRGAINDDSIQRIEGKEVFDHVFIDNFNNTKMKVKTHNVMTFSGKPDQQLSLLLYQQAKDASFCLFVFAVYNG